METFNYKDDRYSIRPRAPPGGETHFNISESEYGDKNIHHPYKRNNHPRNDINPPPNYVKKEEVIESTPNGAAPVTGNRPSIKLRAPPGGFSSLAYYSEETNVEEEPEPRTKKEIKQSNRNSLNTQEDGFCSKKFRPVYAPQAPPGGKTSINLGYDDDPVNYEREQFSTSSKDNYIAHKPKGVPGAEAKSFDINDDEPAPITRHKQKANPEFQESKQPEFQAPTSASGRRSSTSTKQNNQSTFNTTFFNGKDDEMKVTSGKRSSLDTKQNNQSTFNSTFYNGKDDERKVTSGKRSSLDTKQNNQSTFNSTFYNGKEDEQKMTSGKRSSNDTKQNNQSTFNNTYFNGKEEEVKPTSASGRRSSNDTKQNNQSTFNNTFFNGKEDEPYKPYYAPQAPPGGKDSITFDPEVDATFKAGTDGRRRNYQNNHFKGSYVDEETNNTNPYKPYYAPQAPPGGKDSISFGGDDDSTPVSATTDGRRRNYEHDHFRSSLDEEDNSNENVYKPYYAPQAPPGGKDSIALGASSSNESVNETQSFSGRRRNYNNDHFKSSFGFNY